MSQQDEMQQITKLGGEKTPDRGLDRRGQWVKLHPSDLRKVQFNPSILGEILLQ